MKVLTILLLAVLLVLPGFSAPVVAQIATNTPVATQSATPEATVAATEPAVIVVAPVDAKPGPVTSPADGTMSIWVALILIVITAITSGLAGGVGAVRMMVSGFEQVNQNPALIEAMETAIDGLRTSVLADDLLRAVSLGAQIAAKVTDGIPESAKIPPTADTRYTNANTLSEEAQERADALRTLRTAQGFVPPAGFENPGVSVDEAGRVTITPEVQPG